LRPYPARRPQTYLSATNLAAVDGGGISAIALCPKSHSTRLSRQQARLQRYRAFGLQFPRRRTNRLYCSTRPRAISQPALRPADPVRGFAASTVQVFGTVAVTLYRRPR
jgi:hypothetical protein